MIGVAVKGRFGNQLFQYAFAFSAAKKLKTTFYFDQTEGQLIIQNYFEIPYNLSIFLEDMLFSIKGYRNIFSYRAKKLFYNFLNKHTGFNKICIDADTNYKRVMSELKDHTLFEGYFLSENCFIEHAAAIRAIFTIRQHLKMQYQNKYAHLFIHKKIITVHIRKDDYTQLGHLNLGGDDLSLPVSYYHGIIGQLQSANVLFVLISDDVEFVKKEFTYLGNKLVSEDNMINDFQHLLNADVCIIANSTFSWWGAWLNNKSSKKIYAPQYFMGHLINKTWPSTIYPPDWELVNVKEPSISKF